MGASMFVTSYCMHLFACCCVTVCVLVTICVLVTCVLVLAFVGVLASLDGAVTFLLIIVGAVSRLCRCGCVPCLFS